MPSSDAATRNLWAPLTTPRRMYTPTEEQIALSLQQLGMNTPDGMAAGDILDLARRGLFLSSTTAKNPNTPSSSSTGSAEKAAPGLASPFAKVDHGYPRALNFGVPTPPASRQQNHARERPRSQMQPQAAPFRPNQQQHIVPPGLCPPGFGSSQPGLGGCLPSGLGDFQPGLDNASAPGSALSNLGDFPDIVSSSPGLEYSLSGLEKDMP